MRINFLTPRNYMKAAKIFSSNTSGNLLDTAKAPSLFSVCCEDGSSALAMSKFIVCLLVKLLMCSNLHLNFNEAITNKTEHKTLYKFTNCSLQKYLFQKMFDFFSISSLRNQILTSEICQSDFINRC